MQNKQSRLTGDYLQVAAEVVGPGSCRYKTMDRYYRRCQGQTRTVSMEMSHMKDS